MRRQRLAAEQIVTKLRQIEVLQGQGKPIADAARQIGVTAQASGKISPLRSSFLNLLHQADPIVAM